MGILKRRPHNGVPKMGILKRRPQSGHYKLAYPAAAMIYASSRPGAPKVRRDDQIRPPCPAPRATDPVIDIRDVRVHTWHGNPHPPCRDPRVAANSSSSQPASSQPGQQPTLPAAHPASSQPTSSHPIPDSSQPQQPTWPAASNPALMITLQGALAH